jgi:hypothetical protein
MTHEHVRTALHCTALYTVLHRSAKDASEFELLHDDEKRIVIGMSVLALSGALCMLAAIGARPRFLRKPGEQQQMPSDYSYNYDPSPNLFFSLGGSGLLSMRQEDREAQIRKYMIWSCGSGVGSLLLMGWGGVLVGISSVQWLQPVGLTLFVLGVLSFMLMIRQICRLRQARRGTNDLLDINSRQLSGDE